MDLFISKNNMSSIKKYEGLAKLFINFDLTFDTVLQIKSDKSLNKDVVYSLALCFLHNLTEDNIEFILNDSDCNTLLYSLFTSSHELSIDFYKKHFKEIKIYPEWAIKNCIVEIFQHKITEETAEYIINTVRDFKNENLINEIGLSIKTFSGLTYPFIKKYSDIIDFEDLILHRSYFDFHPNDLNLCINDYSDKLQSDEVWRYISWHYSLSIETIEKCIGRIDFNSPLYKNIKNYPDAIKTYIALKFGFTC